MVRGMLRFLGVKYRLRIYPAWQMANARRGRGRVFRAFTGGVPVGGAFSGALWGGPRCRRCGDVGSGFDSELYGIVKPESDKTRAN